MPLTRDQIKRLRTLSHDLKPVVMIGQHGITDNVLNEIEIALDHHELIKIKIAAERDERQSLEAQLLEKTGAEQVQAIGKVLCLFRRNPKKPKVTL